MSGRVDPDNLGGDSARADARSRGASFVVFLSPCPGAGAQEALLEAARSGSLAGIDLVVGAAGTSGDSRPDDRFRGLEVLPGKGQGGELDLDAIIERRPALVLVEGLEAANGPGSRHRRRWQDVLELLDRGIAVWAALDASSVESIAGLVEDSLGMTVPDRVPDGALDRVDEWRLVSPEPEAFARRLAEGQAGFGSLEHAGFKSAIDRRGYELLRSLAERYATRATNRRRSGTADPGSVPRLVLGERILVAVGPSPSSAHLVRWARRASIALRADWLALHVDDGRRRPREEQARIEANLALARRLGAETIVAPGEDIATTVIEAARARDCSMIVLGRSGLSRLGPLPRRATVTDRIVREAGLVDVTVVQDAEAPRADLTFAAARRYFTAPARQYGLLALAFAAVTGLGAILAPAIGYRSIALLYLGAIVGLSLLASPGPVAATAALSAVVLNFLFIPPLYTFSIGSPEDWILFAVYFLVASVTGSLVSRLRSSKALVAGREERAAFLFEAAQRLSECRSAEEAAIEAAALVERHYGTSAAVLAGQVKGGSALPGLGAVESAAAGFSLESGSICGAGTDSYPDSRLRFVPAVARGRSTGAIGIAVPSSRLWTRGDDNLLVSLGRTLASTLERVAAEGRSRKAALELESDRLGRILLDSVSHELRTPLTTITGSISALRDEGLAADPAARRELLEGALEASDRLDRIVEDLLSLSRIESGRLRLTRRTVEPAELARAAIDGAGPGVRGREIQVSLPEGQVVALVDAPLVARLGANLLRNAASYTPPATPVELSLEVEGDGLVMLVRDRGPGVPEGDLERIFERFRAGTVPGSRGAVQAQRPAGGGLGLGLAICRGIAEAHGGSASARNAPGGGLEVRAWFPACVSWGEGR